MRALVGKSDVWTDASFSGTKALYSDDTSTRYDQFKTETAMVANLASGNYYWKRVFAQYPAGNLFDSSTVTLNKLNMPKTNYLTPRLDTFTDDQLITGMAALAQHPHLAYEANLISTKNEAGIYAF